MKKVLRVVLYLAILAVTVNTVSRLFFSGMFSLPFNSTTKIRGFYAEPEDSLDVVFIGASTSYFGVNPSILWREYGIPSYDFCSSELKTQLAQLYVKEAIRTQHPKVIGLDIGGARFADDYEIEEINLVALNDIPWSLDKLKTIFKYTPQKDWASLILPLVKYHSNLKVHFENLAPFSEDQYLGYSPFFDDWGIEYELATAEVLTDTIPLNSKTEEALLDIIAVCEAENVELVFYSTPLPAKTAARQRYNEVMRIAAEHDIPVLDMSRQEWLDANDYNTATDHANSQTHANWRGATKITRALGDFLVEHTSVVDRRGEEAYANWEQKTSAYYSEMREYTGYGVLANITQLEEYLTTVQTLQTEGYCTLILANDEASNNLSEEADEYLRQLGAEESLLKQFRAGYLLVNIDGQTVYSGISKEEPVYFDSAVLERNDVAIQACSAGYEVMAAGINENPIALNTVYIDGKKFTTSRGINIFIYNYKAKTDIVQACFDTYHSGERTK